MTPVLGMQQILLHDGRNGKASYTDGTRMKTHSLLATVAVALLATAAIAQDTPPTYAELMTEIEQQNTRLEALELAASQNVVPIQTVRCESECCRPSGCFAKAEAAFFKYHRADGMRINSSNGSDLGFDHRATPRLTLGYLTSTGLGLRGRYWSFDQFEQGGDTDPSSGVKVDTYNIDAELFYLMEVNDYVDLEFSTGVRYNEFQETLNESGDTNSVMRTAFDGWGLLGGLEFRGCLHQHGTAIARGRGGVLVGDTFQIEDVGDDIPLPDTVHGVYEIAVGYEYARKVGKSILFAEVTAELQQWDNFSYSFEDSDTSSDISGPADVGFSGVVLAFGIRR